LTLICVSTMSRPLYEPRESQLISTLVPRLRAPARGANGMPYGTSVIAFDGPPA